MRRKVETRLHPHGTQALVYQIALKPFQLALDLLTILTQPLLQATEHFILLAFDELQIVVGQVGIFLLHLAFDLVPIAFDLEFIHTIDSWDRRHTDVFFRFHRDGPRSLLLIGNHGTLAARTSATMEKSLDQKLVAILATAKLVKEIRESPHAGLAARAA